MAERAFPFDRSPATHGSGRRISPLEVITAVAIIAALLAIGARATGRLPSERAAPSTDRPTRLVQLGGAWTNVATNPKHERFFRILDPATGAETGETLPFHLPENADLIHFSGDGRTLAYTDNRPSLTPPTVVVNVVTGKTLRTLTYDEPTFVMGLNTDGSRLLLYRFSPTNRPPFSFILSTVEVATGAMVNTIAVPSANDAWPQLTPDLRTAYLLNTHNTDTWPNATSGEATLELIDLATGAQRAIPLPLLRAGTFPQARKIGDETVPRLLSPALTISPDSTRLYIVYPDTDAITVVNLPRGVVERTASITSKQSAMTRVLGWLRPAPVAAKYMEGASKQAHLSPDGRTLAITGTTISLHDDGQTYEIGDMGVQLVDVGTLTETAHLLQRIYQGYAEPLKAQWSADGRLLYLGTVVTSQAGGSNDAYQLQIMDAHTHRITATHTYSADTDTTRSLLETWFALPQQ